MRLFRVSSAIHLQALLLVSYACADILESSPVKAVVEYPLPAAGQTHEILVVNDDLLIISQQTDGSLIKVALDNDGKPVTQCKRSASS
jgi:hypothetical protein